MENLFDNVNASALLSETNSLKMKATNIKNDINKMNYEIKNYVRWTGVKKNEVLSYYELLLKYFNELLKILDACSSVASLISRYKSIAERIKMEKGRMKPNQALISSYRSQLQTLLSQINSRSNVGYSRPNYNYINNVYSTTGFDYDKVQEYSNKTLSIYNDFRSLASSIKSSTWVTSGNRYVARLGNVLGRICNDISNDFPKLTDTFKIFIGKISDCIYELKKIWSNPLPEYPNYIEFDAILKSTVDANTKDKVNYWLNQLEEIDENKKVDEYDNNIEYNSKETEIIEESSEVNEINDEIILANEDHDTSIEQDNNFDDKSLILDEKTLEEPVESLNAGDAPSSSIAFNEQTMDSVSNNVVTNDITSKAEFADQKKMEKIEESKSSNMASNSVNFEQVIINSEDVE